MLTRVVYALIVCLLVVIVALPGTYRLTNVLVGWIRPTLNVDGTPTGFGVALHLIVLFLLLLLPWYHWIQAAGARA